LFLTTSGEKMDYDELLEEVAILHDPLVLASRFYEDMKQFYYDEEAGLCYIEEPYDYFIGEVMDRVEEEYGWESNDINQFLIYMEEMVPSEFKELLFVK